jgi:hypothetical protein
MELLAVVELRQAGFSTPAIRRAVENLRHLSGEDRPLARLTLVVSGSDIAWKDAHELRGVALSALHQPGQRLMIFPVGERHLELLHQLGEAGDGTPAKALQELGGPELSHVA